MMTTAEKQEALVKEAIKNGCTLWYGETDPKVILRDIEFGEFIFNHDFARALFGEEEKIPAIGKTDHGSFSGFGESAFETVTRYGWQHHLQQAVINEDPIGYMYKVVFDKKEL